MTRNVLIVEDEILIANLIKSYIEPHDFKCVGMAIDYNEAIHFLKTKSIDIVLLDISISGTKNGMDVAEYINKNSKIPFVYLTSHSDKTTMEQLEATAPAAYLSKPFKQIDIVTALKLSVKEVHQKKSNFSFTIGKAIYKIDLNELMYVTSNHVYVDMILKNDTLLIRSSVSHLIELLPENSLIRISKSVAVNPNFINRITINSVELESVSFRLSDTYRQNLPSEKH